MDIDLAYYTALDLLKSLIATPRVSKEEGAAANLLQNYIHTQKLNTQRYGNNIWCIAPGYDEQKPTLLLNSHIDTVKPGSGWNHDPFIPFESDGRIYGLGSNDAGASVVSLLQTFLLLSTKDQPYNLIFLASAEEEISGNSGIESALPELPHIDFAVVGEPTQMNPAVAEKGLMVLDCSVYGKAGHAAREEGVNAIYKAIDVINQFRNFKFPETSSLLGDVKLTVTQINAGTQHNVVPAVCDFVVDVRTNELYPNEKAFQMLQSAIDCEMKARSFRLNSSSISTDHPFVKRAILLGKQPYGSPTMSDQTFMKFPSVKMGPGDSARSHTADEYIKHDEIREAIVFYVKLLDDLSILSFNR